MDKQQIALIGALIASVAAAILLHVYFPDVSLMLSGATATP